MFRTDELPSFVEGSPSRINKCNATLKLGSAGVVRPPRLRSQRNGIILLVRSHPSSKEGTSESTDDFTGPINLGNPAEFTILELAQKVVELTGSRSRIVFKPLPSDDPVQRQPDITLARERLAWRPKVDLENGLRRTIAYFAETASGRMPRAL